MGATVTPLRGETVRELTEDKPVFLRRKALRKPGNQERKFDLVVTFGSAIAIFFFLVSWLP
jgi:hypothetical protein